LALSLTDRRIFSGSEYNGGDLGLGLIAVKDRVDKVYEAKPFVKWAGGKGQLLSAFQTFYPHRLLNGRIQRYVEPFVGGGAVLFNVLQNFQVKEAVIIDINSDLINTYNVVKNDVQHLFELLRDMEHIYIAQDIETRKETFYNIRDEFNSGKVDSNLRDIERAGQFIFLNRTCFNGLYRVNRSGNFNVPSGDYKNPSICDAENLFAASYLLKKAEVLCGDYQLSSKYINSKSFVYFDPPYRPLNATSSFTAYSKQNFNDDNQVKLAKFFRQAHDSGALLMLSNSDPHNVDTDDNFFEDLYKGFNISKVQGKRAINSKGSSRGAVSEILVTNFEEYFCLRSISGVNKKYSKDSKK
jgi:DNA adenine methylase